MRLAIHRAISDPGQVVPRAVHKRCGVDELEPLPTWQTRAVLATILPWFEAATGPGVDTADDGGALAVVCLVTAASEEPAAAGYSQAWQIPPASAAAFAAAMTERYGPAELEGIATMAAMRDLAEHADQAGHLFYTET